jgi:hypothetical protein
MYEKMGLAACIQGEESVKEVAWNVFMIQKGDRIKPVLAGTLWRLSYARKINFLYLV